MGLDCTNYLRQSTRQQDVERILELLGYKRAGKDTYFLFDDNDYRYEGGVLARIRKTKGGRLRVHTHTWAYRSKADADVHNETIKLLWKHFGGHFVSD